MRLVIALMAGLALMGGCASTPAGPSVLVLPGAGTSHDQFRADDARCRQASAAELQNTPPGLVRAQTRYDMAYMQCMYAAGHQIPVPGAARPPARPTGP